MTISSSEQPDAAATAAKELEARAGLDPPRHGPGRPKGAPNKKKAKVKTKVEPTEISPEELTAFTFIGATFWTVSARIFKLEELTDEERERLGAAIAPVAKKYLPMLEDYAPEAALLTVVAGLVMEKRKKPKQEESDLEIEAPGERDNGGS